MLNLAKAMAKTNLRVTLKRVYVHQKDFPASEMQEIFDSYRFKVEVIATTQKPK